VPIYEYLCERCGRLTEVMQKVTGRPPATCPGCGGRRLTKVVSRTAFQLKGGGWYADLYGPPAKKDSRKKDAPAGAAAPGAGKAEKAGGQPGKKPAGKGG
jgi:putative FmdB family regulatory protein